MTGFAFPDVLANVIALADSGDPNAGEDLFDRYLPINRHELRMGISVRKEILRRRGAIANANARYPGAKLDETAARELDQLLGRLETATGQPIGEIRQ